MVIPSAMVVASIFGPILSPLFSGDTAFAGSGGGEPRPAPDPPRIWAVVDRIVDEAYVVLFVGLDEREVVLRLSGVGCSVGDGRGFLHASGRRHETAVSDRVRRKRDLLRQRGRGGSMSPPTGEVGASRGTAGGWETSRDRETGLDWGTGLDWENRPGLGNRPGLKNRYQLGNRSRSGEGRRTGRRRFGHRDGVPAVAMRPFWTPRGAQPRPSLPHR